MSIQNDIEFLQDQIQLGKMSADQANIELVRMQRVRVVTNYIPSQTRKVLNDAVKTGELRHMKKDGRKPEVYYHPNFEHLANEERNRTERETLEALAGVVARPE